MSERGIAVVTGASAGIGKVYAERLAARGYDLLLVARDAARLEALGQELAARYAIRTEILPADLSRDDAVARVVDRLREIANLAMLVNNAGFGTTGTLAVADPAGQEAMVRVHVLAATRLTQAALGPMLARGAGAIVNMSSVAGFLFSAGNVNYCATKAYLITLSEGLAAELQGTGVQAQALCPGFTRSEFHQRMKTGVSHIPDWMWLRAEDVVDASLTQLDRRGAVICVPGFRYRLLVALIRLLPRRLILRLTARQTLRKA